MATPFADAIGVVASLFETTFTNAEILRWEERQHLAILEMQGNYGTYRISRREIWYQDGTRKYAYYVLRGETVVAGFDNAPDPMALRLRYDKDYTQHRLEPIPHLHTENKQNVTLTSEMDCTAFIAWLEANLSG